MTDLEVVIGTVEDLISIEWNYSKEHFRLSCYVDNGFKELETMMLCVKQKDSRGVLFSVALENLRLFIEELNKFSAEGSRKYTFFKTDKTPVVKCYICDGDFVVTDNCVIFNSKNKAVHEKCVPRLINNIEYTIDNHDSPLVAQYL